MNKLLLFIFIILFNQNIKLVTSQITPNTLPTTLTITDIPPQSYSFISNDWITCSFDLFFIVSTSDQADGVDTFSTSATNLVHSLLMTEGQKKLYKVSVTDLSTMPLNFIISATSNLGVYISYSLSLNCSIIDATLIEFKAINNGLVKYGISYVSAFTAIGLPKNFQLTSQSTIGATIKSQSNSFYIYWPSQNYQTNFQSPLILDIKVSQSNTVQLQFNPLFKDIVNEQVTEILYPGLAPPFIVKELGQGYSPLIVFVSTSNSNKPFLEFTTSIIGDVLPRPISGTQGSIKYISYFSDLLSDGSTIKEFNLWYQSGSTPSKKDFDKKIQTLTSTMFPSAILVSRVNDLLLPLFKINFQFDNSFESYSISIGTFFIKKHGFPFAFGNGHNAGFQFTASFPTNIQSVLSSYEVTIKSSYLTTTVNVMTNQIFPPTPVPKPIIVSYSFTQIENSIHSLIFKVIDPVGISFIYAQSLRGVMLYAKLISGTPFDGDYELIVNLFDQHLSFIILNTLGESILINNGAYIKLDPPTQLLYPPYMKNDNINFNSFKNVSFLENNLNLNNQSSYNIFYFNSSDIHIKTPMYFILFDPITKQKENLYPYDQFFPILWNSTLQMFNCKFIVPKNNIFGSIEYAIRTSDNDVFFGSTFKNPVPLIVTSTYLDGYGPIFKTIERIPSDSIVIDITGDSVGWILTIQDELNGFDRGYIKVMGKDDSATFHFNFTVSDAISGDKWNGVYQILIPLASPCHSQQYVITEVLLYDTNDIVSEFSIFSDTPNPTANPFINYLGDSTINTIEIDCVTDLVDSSPPELTSFSATPTIIDVGSINRKITFTFGAKDVDTELRNDQKPIVYIQNIRLEILECVSKIISIEPNSATYQCIIELPVGFGFHGESPFVSYSVYGFINNGGYYNGFSSADLKSLGFAFYSSIAYEVVQPIIISTESITSEGGKLIVYGKGLFNIDEMVVSYMEEGGVTFNHTYQPITKTQSFATFNNIKPTTQPFIIKVLSTSQDSNEYKVYPIYSNINYAPVPTQSPTSTPLPSNPPQLCLGEPICGGSSQGYCNHGVGCICYSPWIGLSCSSQVIIVPKPTTNENEPTTEIPITVDDNSISKVLFKSLISLVSLRELNFNQEHVKTITFDKWILTQINSQKSQYFTNITTSPLSSSSQSITTNITVTLEWFTTETKIEFALTNLTMNPSTIKYTIEITEYAFSSNLNSLQLVMSALFTSNNNDVCSSKEFGSTSSGDNSNYIKIQIQGHSLYGRFIKRGIVDNKTVVVSNILLDQSLNIISNYSTSQSYIGISIPNYNTKVILDPDFSVLLDSNTISNGDENSICKSSSPVLSNGQLAGIIIGGFVFLVFISLIALMFISPSKKLAVKIFLYKLKRKPLKTF